MKKWIALLMTLVLALSLCACVVTTPLPEEQLPQKPGDDASTSANPPTGEPTDTPSPEQERPDAEDKVSFTVIVVHADGSEKTFTYETNEQFVGPVLEADGLIKGNAGPYGMEITEVDGEQAIYNTDKAYWAVYEGEEYALQGIDTTPVIEGRTYKLVYTKG
jgi:hypothetical protein